MPRRKKKNETRLEQEEVTTLEAIQITYNNIVKEFGSIAIKRREAVLLLETLEQKEAAANKALEDLKNYEKQTHKTLEEKYGMGSIDVENGIFTPAS